MHKADNSLPFRRTSGRRYVRIPKKRELLLSNIDPINKATSQFGSSSSADGLMEMQQARVV